MITKEQLDEIRGRLKTLLQIIDEFEELQNRMSMATPVDRDEPEPSLMLEDIEAVDTFTTVYKANKGTSVFMLDANEYKGLLKQKLAAKEK